MLRQAVRSSRAIAARAATAMVLWHDSAVELIAGTHVWDELEDRISAATRRRVAIAYAGRHASSLMPLHSGDIVVVDGSDDALEAGSTHPEALAAWSAAGAQVWSLPDLHAKIILFEDATAGVSVVIGSANVSKRANSDLLEAVVVVRDQALCDAVSEQLDLWTGLAERVDDQWLKRARTIYRESKTERRSTQSRRFHVDRTAPLWVGVSQPLDSEVSPAARAEYEQLVSRYDRVGEVVLWQLNRGDEDLDLPGQNVALVNNPSGRDEPVGQAGVWSPAKVVRVVPGRGRHLPVAILVRETDVSRVRLSQVRKVIEDSGDQLDWSRQLGPVAAMRVYELWP